MHSRIIDSIERGVLLNWAHCHLTAFQMVVNFANFLPFCAFSISIFFGKERIINWKHPSCTYLCIIRLQGFPRPLNSVYFSKYVWRNIWPSHLTGDFAAIVLVTRSSKANNFICIWKRLVGSKSSTDIFKRRKFKSHKSMYKSTVKKIRNVLSTTQNSTKMTVLY